MKIIPEIWKVYKETVRTKWDVSNYGNVKKNGEVYECGKSPSGYKCFGRYYLHKAVAELFVPNPENKPHVDHIDTNRINNYWFNLQWCTASENANNPLTIKHQKEAQINKPRSNKTKRNIKNGMKNYFKNNHAKNKNKRRVYDENGKYHYE